MHNFLYFIISMLYELNAQKWVKRSFFVGQMQYGLKSLQLWPIIYGLNSIWPILYGLKTHTSIIELFLYELFSSVNR